MTKFSVVARSLGVLAGVLASGVIASAAPAAAATAPSKTFPTTVADVHVRSLPRTGRGSKKVKVLPAARTAVTVSCYVSGQAIGGDRIWYRITAPAAGYVAGFYLHTGHDPAKGITRCP
jgi:hypothetical protein